MMEKKISEEVFRELGEIRGILIAIQEQQGNSLNSNSDTLWTVEQVAKYLHKSKGTIQSHYQGKPGFPRSRKIGNKHYWFPKEIVAYARK